MMFLPGFPSLPLDLEVQEALENHHDLRDLSVEMIDRSGIKELDFFFTNDVVLKVTYPKPILVHLEVLVDRDTPGPLVSQEDH